MRIVKLLLLPAGLFLISLLPSCKGNEPAAPAAVKFTDPTVTYAEDRGAINIGVSMAAAQSADVTVSYKLAQNPTTYLNGDFSISSTSPITIPAGQTSGNIQVQIIDDTQIDSTDVLTFTLTAATGNAAISKTTAETVFVLNITNNDEVPNNKLQVDLTWDEGPGTNINNVNLDLFLQDSVVITNNAITDVGKTYTSSRNTTGFETLFLNATDTQQDYYVAVSYNTGSSTVNYNVAFNGFGWVPDSNNDNIYTDTFTPADVQLATFIGAFTFDGSNFVLSGRQAVKPTQPGVKILHFKVADILSRIAARK
jgi:Calx-beta domain